ncbi:MAG: 16S rRNA (adenine(1518)-N(6)/adenine(1519)-N(6))-dimethyltransferase RsmA [Myxococcota bacterium]
MSDDPRALLRQLETRARKRFGQHFLTRPETVDRIVRGARVEPGDRVVEIGPGLGILTRALLRAEAKVTAVELDRDLAAYIREALPEVTLIEGDAARVDWATVVEPGAKVVANLPYNVGTKVLMQMLRTPDRFASITVMLQKEVVDRLMASPNSRQYGALTVEAAVRGEPVYVMTVEPGAFHPPPKVRSAVIRFDVFEGGARVGTVEPRFFDKVVKAAFSQRRKTLTNSMGGLFDKEAIARALSDRGLPAQARAESLTVDDFRAIAAALAEAGTAQ